MAYFRCGNGNSGGGGGQTTETTLWTNPNPSANFVGQTVTLSSPITDFDLIGVYFKNLTSSTKTGKVYFSTKEDNLAVAMYHVYGGDRQCIADISTPRSLQIVSCTGGNSYLIPLQIIGVTF